MKVNVAAINANSRNVHLGLMRIQGPRLLRALLAMVCLVLLAAPTQAVPVIYTFAGDTSGTFGGIPFNNTDVTLSLFADTDNIVIDDLGYSTLTVVAGSYATVSVTGVGSGTFTTPTDVRTVTLPGSPASAQVGFSDPNPDGSGYFMWQFFSSAFYNYSLGPIGPVVGLHNNNGAPIDEPTTFGDLVIPSPTLVVNASFTAVEVPEPSIILLFGLSAGICCLTLRWSQRPLRLEIWNEI